MNKIALMLTLLAFNVSAEDGTSNNSTTVNLDSVTQTNTGQVTSQGSYTQYNLGGGGNNFGTNDIPTYERIGRVQCATSTFSAKAYGLTRHLNQGALQMGFTVPLTSGRCQNAQDDEVALMQHELHVAKIEQEKKNQLFAMKVAREAFESNKKTVLFESQMADVCSQLHGKILLADSTSLSAMCNLYQPIDKNHTHGDDPQRNGFTKPAAHHYERVAQEEVTMEEYVKRNDEEEVHIKNRDG